MATKKMPAKVKKGFKAKPKPAKTGHAVPPALAAWHKAHPRASNAHKSYGPNAGHSSTKSKGK